MKKSSSFRCIYRNILIDGDKGGVRKTGLATLFGSVGYNMEAPMRLYEVDRQTLLRDLFPKVTSIVRLPSAEELAAGSMADIESMTDVMESMMSPDQIVTLVDIGSGFDQAFADVAIRVDLDEEIVASSRQTALIFPLNGSDEAVLAAARSSVRMGIAFPSAHHIFCGPDANFKPTGREARRVWDSIIEPHIEAHGFIVFPDAGLAAYDIFTSTRVPPHAYVEMSPRDIAAMTGQAHFKSKASKAQIGLLLVAMEEEAERVLGFRKSGAEDVVSG